MRIKQVKRSLIVDKDNKQMVKCTNKMYSQHIVFTVSVNTVLQFKYKNT